MGRKHCRLVPVVQGGDGGDDIERGRWEQVGLHPYLRGLVWHRRGAYYRRFAACLQTARRREYLPYASSPEVPFCATATMAPIVVLARCSVLGRMHANADSGRAGIHRHSQALRSSASAMCAE